MALSPRRNPARAGKQASVEELVKERTQYLAQHVRAKASAAEKKVRAKIARLKAGAWPRMETEGRSVGAGYIRPVRRRRRGGTAAFKQAVQNRYKDLTEVEVAVRNSKTAHLELRPIHVRTQAHTRGHALVAMLAYPIRVRSNGASPRPYQAGQALQTRRFFSVYALLGFSTVRS
jgi:hypothetical protein